MGIEPSKIMEFWANFLEIEIDKKHKDPNYKIVIHEADLVKQLGASDDEDIKNIRICASSSIDAFNAHSQGFQIETDINQYEMERARYYRKRELDK